MDNWDQQKLEEVVEKKHGEKEKKNTTEIVCSLSCAPMCSYIHIAWKQSLAEILVWLCILDKVHE